MDFSIFIAIIVSFGTFFGALLALHSLWLKPHSSEIPTSEDNEIPHSPRRRIRGEDIKQIKSLREMLKTYLPLIKSLESKYWINNIGLDGYAYLYFQRQLIKLLLIFMAVYLLLFIPLSIYYSNIQVPQDPADFTLETRNEKIKYYQELRSIIDCLMVYFISLYSIYTIYTIKVHIKDLLTEQKRSSKTRINFEKMKSQSVHVTGIFPEDRTGEILHAQINDFLDEANGGRILSSIILHDFIKVVELENERKRINDAHKLYIANEPAVRRMCFPSKYRREEYYTTKLKSIDEKVFYYKKIDLTFRLKLNL